MTDAEWRSRLCTTAFFGPCRLHATVPKNECTFFCLDAPLAPPLCAHCAPLVNPGLRLMQIRRYMYRDVVKNDDISKHMDVSGVQTYIVNGCGVVFILPKEGSSAAQAMSACTHCRKGLRAGATFCSVACKVLSGAAVGKPVSFRQRQRKQPRPRRA